MASSSSRSTSTNGSDSFTFLVFSDKKEDDGGDVSPTFPMQHQPAGLDLSAITEEALPVVTTPIDVSLPKLVTAEELLSEGTKVYVCWKDKHFYPGQHFDGG